MALKKSELYFSLWSSCDELRRGRQPIKDYVLVLLFVRSMCRGRFANHGLVTGRQNVSDKYARVRYAPITTPPVPASNREGHSRLRGSIFRCFL